MTVSPSWAGSSRQTQLTLPRLAAVLASPTAGQLSAPSTAVRTSAMVAEAARLAHAELVGLGPLQSLADRVGVTDILVNAPDEIWTDGPEGLRREPLRFDSESQVRALAVRLASVAGRRLDEAHPWVDARLPDGVRLHALLPPISCSGTVISLRLAARHRFDLPSLVAAGTIAAPWQAVLQAVLASKLGFLISGATGSGKTTVLSALLGACPDDRLVIVEDTAELDPPVQHRLSLQARNPNNEGAGGVAMSELVRQALRMRPDRLVIGECRGAEVTDLLAALNTGHSGCATLHANSARDVPARVEALALAAGLPQAAIATQLVAAIQLVVHVRRVGERRLLSELAVLRLDHGEVAVDPALTFDPGTGQTLVGSGWPQLAMHLEMVVEAAP